MAPTIWSRRAHRALPNVLVAAGRLEVDRREVRFTPTRTERLFGRRPWSVPLDAVVTVDVVPRRLGDVMRGGAVRRLRIVDASGHEELFVVVPGTDRAVDSVRAALDQPSASRTTV